MNSILPPEIIAHLAQNRITTLALRCTCKAFSALIAAKKWPITAGKFEYLDGTYTIITADDMIVFSGPRRDSCVVKARERLLIGENVLTTYKRYCTRIHIESEDAINRSTGIVTGIHNAMWYIWVTITDNTFSQQYVDDIIARTFTLTTSRDYEKPDLIVRVRALASEIVAKFGYKNDRTFVRAE